MTRLPSLQKCHRELGIPTDYDERCGHARFDEATELEEIGADIYDRPQRMLPAAATALAKMLDKAAADGIVLQVVSAFRSIDYQADVIRGKLEQGRTLDDVLQANVAPGYSEHHTGRAVDLTTPGSPVLEEEFEQTSAFRWLHENAPHFGFRLSYPRDNAWGICYEPWHWAWVGDSEIDLDGARS